MNPNANINGNVPGMGGLQDNTVNNMPSNNISAQQGDDIVFRDKPKKNTGMIFGMVFLALLAAGGIGFGVWTISNSNTEKDSLNAQISSLKQQNDGLMEKLNNDDTATDNDTNNISTNTNPIIKSTNSEETYGIHFNSSLINGNNLISIAIVDGEINECYIGQREDLGSGGYSTKKISDCNITGLDGKIYNIVEFGAGQDNGLNNIGFIMTDGAVKYIPLYDSVENNNFAIRGNINIDGNVIDILDIAVSPTNAPVGGYRSSVFVLSNGSYVKFDESMLK